MLELLLSAAVGGTVEALAGKALEGPLAKRTETVRQKIGGQPAGVAAEAVRRAVENARLEVRDGYFAGEDEHSREVVTLLDHAPFAQEVTRRILSQGVPDFERLRRHYLERHGKGASERWAALELPLDALFEAIERHLAADPNFGSVVRDTQQLVRLTKLKGLTQIIAASSQNIEQLQRQVAASGERTAQASEQGVDLLQVLVERSGDQGASLERIVDLLAAGSSRTEGEEAAATSSPSLVREEVLYLRRCLADCDRLPLAEEAREVGDRKLIRPSLGRVYVELETTFGGSLELAALRLGVDEETLRNVLEDFGPGGGAPPQTAANFMAQGRVNKAALSKLSKDVGRDLKAEALSEAFESLSAEEATRRFQRLVLLGDPGSGKSTFINHLTHRRAKDLFGEDVESERATGFPLRVLLRKWRPSDTSQGEPAEGAELIYRLLEQSVPGLERQRLLERLEDHDTLVVLDGLDEVPAAEEAEEDRRRQVVAAVESFAVAHPCRLLVTCRVKPYEDPAYQLDSFADVTLAPLDDERIRTFVHRWYQELARIGRLQPEEAEERRERLLHALGDRPVLRQMAETPLLLTMLARVNARAVLPDNRAELYRECVEQLLWEWERQKSEGGLESLVSLLEEPGVDLDRADVERVLWRLTYAAHGGEGDAQISAGKLREALAEIHPRRHEGWSWASRVVELMRERGGLLVEKEIDLFSFPHRSFQEYLAARWLLEQENWTVEARKLASRDTWREVLLLACGHLRSQGSYQDVQTLLSELIEGVEGPEEGAAADGSTARVILLAGAIWVEFGPHRAVGETGKRIRQRIPELLQPVMVHKEVAPKQRLEAGLGLADLGVLPEDLDDWVEIPADTLDYSFKIGKYPVTNAQYRRFVEAGGYDPEREWWSEEARREILTRKDGSRLKHPRLWGNRKYDRASLPVVGVTWHEAQAYCFWLTVELRAEGELPDDEEIRLSTLSEWLRTAGGVEGLEFPWGKSFETWRANGKESDLKRSSPVSMYPGGASAEGVWDLAGNVWEWSLDKAKLTGLPWLKGGAYYLDGEQVGASALYCHLPDVWFHFAGFRCVCSPVSRADSES